MNDTLADAVRRFRLDTRLHRLEIVHDDGLYRHLRARRRPRNKTSASSLYWFDIITWPGSLAIRGDYGSDYVFSRDPDMFAFFRQRNGRINPSYWAEKTSGGCRAAKSYSEDALRLNIAEELRREYESLDLEPRESRDHMRELREEVRDVFFDDWDGCSRFEESAHRALDDFSFVSTAGRKFQFEDWYEWDLREWDWSYLWACHAIVWAINGYDAAKAAQAEAVAA